MGILVVLFIKISNTDTTRSGALQILITKLLRNDYVEKAYVIVDGPSVGWGRYKPVDPLGAFRNSRLHAGTGFHLVFSYPPPSLTSHHATHTIT